MSLVDTNWLEEKIDNVKIIDCSWHMPQTKRSGLEEYKNQHIPNSIFFDLDATHIRLDPKIRVLVLNIHRTLF